MVSREEESILIDEALAGDEKAYWKIVNIYKDRLFRVSYCILHNADEAEDIVQDVFVKMYKNLNKFRRQSSIYTWLYRITVNLSCNRIRSKKTRPQSSLNEIVDDKKYVKIMTDPKRTPEQKLMRSQTQDAIIEAIKTLSPKLQEVIIMRYYNEMDYKEIADMLNVNMGTIKSRLFAAREILKKNINADALFHD